MDNACSALKAPGRPRSEEARQAILRAAYEILVESGLGGFSVEAVAVRASVARTTIYRWWPSKGLLAVESFLDMMRSQISFHRSASVIYDFEAMLQSVAAVMRGPGGRVVVSILSEAQRDPETRRAFNQSYHQVLRRESVALLRDGVRTGELRPDLDPDAVLDAGVGAIYLRLLLGEEMDQGWVRTLAATLIEGVSPHALPRPHGSWTALK